MDEKLKQTLTNKESWVRGLYMLLFALIYWAAKMLIAIVVVFQFGITLFTGKPNNLLLEFGQKLSTFIYQMMLFFTYNSEQKPYPFSPWPQGVPEGQTNNPEREKKAKKKTIPKPKPATGKTTKSSTKLT